MAKILFISIPAYGHVNPTLPIVTELVQRGHHVVYYNADTFEQVIKGTGAEFRSYPNSSTSEAEFAKRVNNLVGVRLGNEVLGFEHELEVGLVGVMRAVGAQRGVNLHGHFYRVPHPEAQGRVRQAGVGRAWLDFN